MPILIRIVLQRIFVFIMSFLTFLGIAPNVTLPSEEDARIRQEQRQEIIQRYIEPGDINIVPQINILKIPEEPVPKPESQNVFTQPKREDIFLPQQTQGKDLTETQINVVEEVKKIIEEPIAQIHNSAQESVVNIICLHRSGNTIETHTGSGVIIDPRGIVVTNAHVAQYFLLESSTNPNFMQCTLYKENLSLFGYKAKILYISPQWVRNNYTLIRDANPKGTGAGDYAFLYITSSTNANIPKQNNLTHSIFSLNHKYRTGENIFVAGYPGAPKSYLEISQSGKLRTANTFISDVFTLIGNTIDIITTGVTDVAQRGSSGGGVFSGNNLIGLIVTITPDTSGGNKINALTTEYINRHLVQNAGFSIDELKKGDFISGDLNSKVNDFYENFVPELRNLLLRIY
jgi:hypothetical protein